MRDPDRRRAASFGNRVLRWAERLFVTAGAALLVWCALLVTDTIVFQWEASRSFETAAHAPPPATLHGRGGAAAAPAPAPIVRQGSAIARLSIPRVQLSAMVLHGSDAETLRRGPGHMENTALPGKPGNVVIAGHRDSFFRPLRNVELGDTIFVDTPQARFHYQVTSLRVVRARDLSVLEPTDDAVLTLITCYPFWVLGDAPDRFVVRAIRVVVDPPIAAAVARATPPQESSGASTVAAPRAADPIVPDIPGVHGDEALVRRAIEQFRLTYNARLLSHNDVRPDGPLRFEACNITITGDEAVATCQVFSQLAHGGRPPQFWTFTLDRVDNGWAMRSIAT
jgi:sortase A